MNDYDLTKEEQQLVNSYDKGEFVSAADINIRKKEIQKIAKNTLNKTRNINIRLSERDLYRLKAKAVEEGIPYQTLASSILHKSTSR